MSEANTQAFNIKAYVNNLLSEKRELEAANSALEAEKTKLKQGILKYGEIAKNMETQNKDQQNKIQMMQRQIDALQQENTQITAVVPISADYSSEIAETLLLAQRTAKQLVTEAEEKATLMTQDARVALSNVCAAVADIRDHLQNIGSDIGVVEARLEVVKENVGMVDEPAPVIEEPLAIEESIPEAIEEDFAGVMEPSL